MKKLLLALLLVGLSGVPAFAQQYFQNTMFNYTQFGYNPAAVNAKRVGVVESPSLTMLGRLQWLGFDGAPQTSYLAYETDLPSEAGYAGGLLLVDALGSISTVTLSASYAYEFELGTSNSFLRIGASGGMKQWRLDPTGFVAIDDNDVIIPDGVTSVIVPALSTGIYLTGKYIGKGDELRYYVGLSAQNLLEPSYDNALAATRNGTEDVRTFVLSGGYNFIINERLTVMPSVMVMNDFALSAPQVSTNVMLNYNPISVGLTYRAVGNESIGAMAGFYINDNIFMGYSYDYPTTNLNASNDVNSHELVLIYRFGQAKSGPSSKFEDTFKDADNN
ncbi:MAG: PorP/SprF family type IX secretion system membrane protein [Bacteroidota bacterium]